MNYLPWKASLLAALLPASLCAQDQATTLTRLCTTAEVIVEATVSGVVQPTAEIRQLTLTTGAILKGAIGTSFTLSEPAGRCCGRALFNLNIGDTRILFLKRVGPTLHTTGGNRGVIAATQDLRSHVQALRAAPSSNALAHVLANNINHHEPRIADDAALALSVHPNLSLTLSERNAVATSLSQSVQHGLTRTAALADIAARLGDANMVDTVVPVFLQATKTDQALLLRKALTRCPAQLVADRLPIHVGTTRHANLRAAQLLAEMPSTVALGAMANLLQRPNHPQVQMELCEGLMSAGVSAASLSPMVPPPVLQLAIERLKRRPTFRNINPRR